MEEINSVDFRGPRLCIFSVGFTRVEIKSTFEMLVIRSVFYTILERYV